MFYKGYIMNLTTVMPKPATKEKRNKHRKVDKELERSPECFFNGKVITSSALRWELIITKKIPSEDIDTVIMAAIKRRLEFLAK